MKSWQEWSNTAIRWYQNGSAGSWRGIAVVGGLLVLLVLASQSLWAPQARTPLLEGCQLSMDEIGAIQIALGKAGLDDYEIEGTSVLVPRNGRSNYLKAVSDHGAIPADLAGRVRQESGLDYFRSRSWQRQQQLERKKQSIREMVQQMSFVTRAIVDYDEARGATPFEAIQRTAIVTVQPVGTRCLENPEVKAIRDTVQGAVAGLMANDVTIIDLNGHRSWVGIPDTDRTPPDHPHAATRNLEEQNYENKIRSALSAYPGIRVNVEVAVDPVIRHLKNRHTVDPDQQPLTRTETREYVPMAPSTTPSVEPVEQTTVGTNHQARVPEDLSGLPLIRETLTVRRPGSGSSETVEKSGLTVTAVRVSIGVPERCIDWYLTRHDQHPGGPDHEQEPPVRAAVFEEISADIRQKIAPLLPENVNMNHPDSALAVTIDPDIRLDQPETLTSATADNDGWQQWQNWALVTLGIAFLVLLRPGLKAAVSRQPAPSHTRPPATSGGNRMVSGEASHAPATVVPLNPGRDELMRQDLDRWCRDNPDAAAATIRQWADRQAG